MTVDSLVSDVSGVGEEIAKRFATLGIKTAQDLIHYYPRRYDDYSNVQPIGKIKPGIVTVKALIKQARGRYVRRGLHITEAVASDETGSVRIIWFNQPYRTASLKNDQEYYLSGEFALSHQRLSIQNPSVELLSSFPVNTARIVPIYRETKGLKSIQIRKVVKELMPLIRELPESLPEWLIKNEKLIARAEAVETMHFPSGAKNLAAAKRRLGFEEVFELTLAALLNKYELLNETAVSIPFDEKLAREFVSHLPFKLTDAQRKAVWQIYQDIQKTQPMNRLLEGDVGSGKTVVAAMAAAMVMNTRPTHLNAAQGSKEERAKRTKSTVSERLTPADTAMRQEPAGVASSAGQQGKAVSGSEEQGFQVALMAPTELLARQHAETIFNLLKPLGMSDQVGLLIGSLSASQKKAAQASIKKGRIRFMIGTHALIAEKVDMDNLGLIVIDEQHRFGVEQRKKLQAKAGHALHVLNMTATPIPRSLALTLYGELDISILETKPANRKPIVTKLCTPNSRKQLYEKIDLELATGRQMFVVTPLIKESTAGFDAKSAEQAYEDLRKGPFKHRRVGLLHGKMRPDEKETVMRQFIDQELDILVATTVIEVGVDVPNATVMLIENAERFGLAQIHQLRGRVGRSEHQGYAYLMLDGSAEPGQRLRALESSSDGFKLAELDLEIRGPGAIYGALQHGALDLRVAKITDTRLIAAARQSAQSFIDRGENLLKYKHLFERVSKLRSVTNLN